MKDLSLFLLKNSLGAKMKKGIRNFCNGDDSTSTLNQHNKANRGDSSSNMVTQSPAGSPYNMHNINANSGQSPTLEEMILQLELEEEIARKAKLNDQYYCSRVQGRMSCVNNSDILRSARNALNQYPRFSLDGRDAMYRSSFRNMNGRKSVCCDRGLRGRFSENDHDPFDSSLNKTWSLAGESVVWCKPGVVAKLMGLEAMPVPLISTSRDGKEKLSSIIQRQNLRRRAERHEIERRLAMDHINGCDGTKRGRMASSSCSRTTSTGYCVMKPVEVEPARVAAVWPARRFL
jgi:hypothetical protein